ncbi:hypothetical protein JOB18_046082 [Solea senegalensis]|uniref:Uncharacterized protein n=1 Tax=Solea senegalensis TaxID=28829 RepID=A0AAV6RHR5_SOLSE|nr:hypothetical protein JOB18_046082 [Solea senegalensis]KAG7503849.1 hypothetical protein JOB18_046082 [Solea senegalensis]
MEFGLRMIVLLLTVTAAVGAKGINLFEILRGRGASSSEPKPTKGTEGGGFKFNLEDALHSAATPTSKSSEECQRNVVQQLERVIKNQNQQQRLLMQLMAQSSSLSNRRFMHK